MQSRIYHDSAQGPGKSGNRTCGPHGPQTAFWELFKGTASVPKEFVSPWGLIPKLGSNLGPNADNLGPKPSTITQNNARRANKIDFLQLPWAQEVPSSNLGAPTSIPASEECVKFLASLGISARRSDPGNDRKPILKNECFLISRARGME